MSSSNSSPSSARPPARPASALFSAPGNGVTCHFDSEEVFSIQLSGEKRWRIAKADVDHPWPVQFNPRDALLDDELYTMAGKGFPEPDLAEWQTVDMKPGSVLFLPRGTWHETEAGEESLSLSIMLRTPPALETALAALRLRMLQDPKWRRPLFGAWGNRAETARTQWQELLEHLPAFIDTLSFDNALLPALDEAARLERVHRHSRVQTRAEARMILNHADGLTFADVFFRDRQGAEQLSLKLEVPPEMHGLFDWLAEARVPFTADELAARFGALPIDQHLRIVDALLRGRYLKQLWFDPPPD
jgi:hypothetical protein